MRAGTSDGREVSVCDVLPCVCVSVCQMRSFVDCASFGDWLLVWIWRSDRYFMLVDGRVHAPSEF